jgi:uncharacterized protein with HEPN domain
MLKKIKNFINNIGNYSSNVDSSMFEIDALIQYGEYFFFYIFGKNFFKKRMKRMFG